MEQKSIQEIQAELAKPFAPEDLEWRLQKTIEDKMRGIAVPYVTNRAIQNRLDEVVGINNWHNDYKPWHSAGKKEAQICGISIYFEGRGFLTKWDGAEDSDIEPVKGGLSDSMKRAAVQWGIGRILYSMDVVWVNIEKQGRSFVIPKSDRANLDRAYLDMLKKLGLTPAPAGGIQSQLTPTRAPKPKTETESPAAPPKPAPPVDAGLYTVQESKVQKGMSGSSTQVVLLDPGGKQIRVFVRGEYPELVPGVILTDVKLALRKQDTISFYVMEKFQFVCSENKAA